MSNSVSFGWYTGWLKIKYPTRQYAIFLQPVVRFQNLLKLFNPDTSLNPTLYNVSTSPKLYNHAHCRVKQLLWKLQFSLQCLYWNQKRHERCKKLREECLFTDEKNFYLNHPVNHQNDRVWSVGKKRDVDKRRLVMERAKFAKHVMASAGVCYGGKEDCISLQTRRKLMVNFTVKSCYPDWLKIASRFCNRVSFSSRTEHLHVTYGEAGWKLDCHQLQWLHRKRTTELIRP